MKIIIAKNPDVLSEYKFIFSFREENKKGEMRQISFRSREGDISDLFDRKFDELKNLNFIDINLNN